MITFHIHAVCVRSGIALRPSSRGSAEWFENGPRYKDQGSRVQTFFGCPLTITSCCEYIGTCVQ